MNTVFVDVYLRSGSASALAQGLAGFSWVTWAGGPESMQGAGWAFDPIGRIAVSPPARERDGRVAVVTGWHANLRLYGADATGRATALWEAHQAGMPGGGEVLGIEAVDELGVRSTLYGTPPATPARQFA